MTLRERIVRGPDPKPEREPVAIAIRPERDDRPEWLRRAAFRRDLTEATR